MISCLKKKKKNVADDNKITYTIHLIYPYYTFNSIDRIQKKKKFNYIYVI